MTGSEDETTDDALTDAAFFARSPNRLAVLDALHVDPTPRADLQARSDVERVTFGRVLDDLLDREWARETTSGYVVTPTGAWARDSFEDLLETLGAIRRLTGLVEFLPDGFPLRALGDAEVVRPKRGDPAAPLRRAERHTRETTHQRVVTDALAPGVLEVMHAGVTEGELQLEAVLGPSMLSVTSAAPETRERFGELLAAEATTFRYMTTDVDIVLGIHDPGVGIGIGVIDTTGAALGLIESDTPAVRDWAVDTFERYWHAADPLDPEPFDIDG